MAQLVWPWTCLTLQTRSHGLQRWAPDQHGFVSEGNLSCAVQNWFATLCASAQPNMRPRYIGFKELSSNVSMASRTPHAPEQWMGFMERVFPTARFVMSTRTDTEKQAHSGFMDHRNGGRGANVSQLDEETQMLLAWHGRLGANRSFWLPLESSGFDVSQFDVPSRAGLASDATSPRLRTQMSMTSTSRTRLKPAAGARTVRREGVAFPHGAALCLARWRQVYSVAPFGSFACTACCAP